MILLAAFLIGIVAGLRALTPLAAVSWAAHARRLHVDGTWLAFLGYNWSPWIFSLLALGELVNDKLPKTPSRKVPPQFGARIVTGAIAGGAIGANANAIVTGLLLGGVGAVVGTLGGAAFRGRMARSFGRDLPAALIEDGIAVLGAILLVTLLG